MNSPLQWFPLQPAKNWIKSLLIKYSFMLLMLHYFLLVLNFMVLLDPDMLEVGNGGMTVEEYRSHFSIWAIAKVGRETA